MSDIVWHSKMFHANCTHFLYQFSVARKCVALVILQLTRPLFSLYSAMKKRRIPPILWPILTQFDTKYDAFCMMQECSSVLQTMWNILSSQDLHSATVCIVLSWHLRLNMRQRTHHVLCNTSSCHHAHVSQISRIRDRGSLVYCMKLSFWRMGKPLVGVWVVGAPLNELGPQVTGSWSRHWHRSQVKCHWRQIGEHSVLPAAGGRLEKTPFYLSLEADWRRLYSTCHWRQTGEDSALPATGGRLENTPF